MDGLIREVEVEWPAAVPALNALDGKVRVEVRAVCETEKRTAKMRSGRYSRKCFGGTLSLTPDLVNDVGAGQVVVPHVPVADGGVMRAGSGALVLARRRTAPPAQETPPSYTASRRDGGDRQPAGAGYQW